LDWTVGDRFRILTISFDPLETPDLARLKRQNYLAEYGRPAAAAGWDFLTGHSKPIRELLDATGFPARWDEHQRQYVHPACLIVLTPDGRISRYLYGVFFEPKTLRLSLVEASEGKIGTTVDHILLYCFHYDPAGGRYTVAAMNLARAGGLLTASVLGSMLALLWRRDRQRRVPVSIGDHSETKSSE
jgi:protein SCO1/2